MKSETTNPRRKRWLLLAIPVAALLLFVPRLVVQADPPALPAMGVTPTPTFTSTPEDKGEVDLRIVKRADKEVADIGEEVVFTLEVSNPAEDAAVEVIVTDDIAPELEILEVTSTQTDLSTLNPAIQIDGQKVTVGVGTVGQYDQQGKPFVVYITIRVRVLSAPEDCAIDNIAHAASTNAGERWSNTVTVLLPSTLPVCGDTRLSAWWAVAMVAVVAGVVVGAWRLRLARTAARL